MYVYILYNSILLKVFFKNLALIFKKFTARANWLNMVHSFWRSWFITSWFLDSNVWMHMFLKLTALSDCPGWDIRQGPQTQGSKWTPLSLGNKVGRSACLTGLPGTGWNLRKEGRVPAAPTSMGTTPTPPLPPHRLTGLIDDSLTPTLNQGTSVNGRFFNLR